MVIGAQETLEVFRFLSFALKVAVNVPVLVYLWEKGEPLVVPIVLALPSPQSSTICSGAAPPVVVSRTDRLQLSAAGVHVAPATGGTAGEVMAMLRVEVPTTLPSAVSETVSLIVFVPAVA